MADRCSLAPGSVTEHERYHTDVMLLLRDERLMPLSGQQSSASNCVQAPMLELMHKHMDAKGKQAKLKSPAELQASHLWHLMFASHELLAESLRPWFIRQGRAMMRRSDIALRQVQSEGSMRSTAGAAGCDARPAERPGRAAQRARDGRAAREVPHRQGAAVTQGCHASIYPPCTSNTGFGFAMSPPKAYSFSIMDCL